MSIRLRQIALVANKLAPVIDDLKACSARGLLHRSRRRSVRAGEFAAACRQQLHRSGRADQRRHRGRALLEAARRRRRLHGHLPMRKSCGAARAARARSLDEHPNRVGARERRLSRDAVASGGHGRLILRNRLGREGRAQGNWEPAGGQRMAQGEANRNRRCILSGRTAIA